MTTGVNRASISRRTGLSRTTVSDIVTGLIEAGVVEESGSGASRGGRRPILLRPVADARGLVGIEAGASHIDVVIMNLTGQVVASERVDHRVPSDVEGTLDLIARLVDTCTQRSGFDRAALLGAGLAVSSPLDGDDLRHVSRMTMPAWDGVDVVEALEACIGMPVVMDNDANLGAVAERWWGAGRGCGDLTYIKLGVGVGAGHIIDGNLYRGSGGTAGELGHINVGGERTCRCGLTGCVETEVGSDAVVASYAERTNSDGASIEEVVRECRAGEPTAVGLVRDAASELGRAVAPILNLLNPDTIIFSGPLTEAGDVFMDGVRSSIVEHSLPKTVSEARIIVSAFKHLTVALGAATAALALRFDGGVEAWHRGPAMAPYVS